MQTIEKRIMKLMISDFNDNKQQDNKNPILFFLLEGQAEVMVNGVKLLLCQEDFLLVNANENYFIKMIRPGLVGIIIMNYRMLNDYVDLYEHEFSCNSFVEKDENLHG